MVGLLSSGSKKLPNLFNVLCEVSIVQIINDILGENSSKQLNCNIGKKNFREKYSWK